jgi:periplasmic divalent cation tolerance protein
MKLSLLYTTFPTHDEALTISRELLAQRLISCANILGTITSVYTWKGKPEESQEIAVLLKTTSPHVDKLIETLQSLHSYETLAILEIPIEKCPPSFAAWVADAVN